jgi:hypothetical protein
MSIQPSNYPSEAVTDRTTGIHRGGHPVAVLSAAVLRLTRQHRGESRASFAVRAGVAQAAVYGAEDGSCPAWALPYFEFTALADAVSVWWPRPAFETAAACDLLMSCVLAGDLVFATDVLAAETRDLAKALLRWAITGEVHTPQGDTVGAGQLLSTAQAALLGERATALSVSGSPDAWVGAELLAIWRGDL